jgi:hypothetical protein
MRRNTFILMLLITIGAITVGDAIAARYTDPGLARILLVGAITAAIVFPIGKLGEYLGLIRGEFHFSKAGAPPDRDDEDQRVGENK